MNTKLRLLILEDRATDAELMLRELRRAGFDPEWKRVETEADFLAQLDAGWEIILADYNLPQFTGLRALELLKERALDVPFILVSASVGEDIAVDAMRIGASDYVMKDRLARLGPAVERELRDAAERRSRKQAEDELRENESKYSRLVEGAPDVIYSFSNQRGGLYYSAHVEVVLGYSVQHLLEHPFLWQTSIEPADLEKIRLAVQKLATGESFDIEYRIKDAGGKWHWLRDRSIGQSRNGDEILIEGIATDITQNKQAEAYQEMGREVLQILNEPGELRDSIPRIIAAAKARTGFDAVGIRLQDGDDFPYRAQIGFSTEFLLTENSLIARAVDGGVCRGKDGSVCLECTCGLVLSGKTDPANPLFTAGGSFWTNDSFPLLDLPPVQDPRLHPRNQCIHQRYASVALVPIRNTGTIVGLIQFNDRRKGCFTRNTVEILEGIATHLGAALMRQQAAVEHDKLEQQLRQAQKMEAVGRLAGGVAHDFNNMLQTILGNAELLLADSPPEDQRTVDLQEIVKAAQRSADLTRQLLAFARKQTIAPVTLDLNDAVADMLKMLGRLIGEDIALFWKPAVELWPIKMDLCQLDQVLANLTVNARDAITGVGKVTVETGNVVLDERYGQAHPDVVPGAYVTLAVSDTGCGMDQETLGHIFEPFFTTKEEGKGTGLGLATVFGIVKQNHGSIDVCSETGKGTTFKIYLPRHVATAEESEEVLKPAAAPTGTETVLLVEDEAALLRLGCRLMEVLGYTVLAAESPSEATRIAGEYTGDIHLLLTDVVMPGLNGRDLRDRLCLTRPGMKCLFMSGYTADVIGRSGVLDRGLHFIQKPFAKAALAVKLRQVLTGKT